MRELEKKKNSELGRLRKEYRNLEDGKLREIDMLMEEREKLEEEIEALRDKEKL